MLLKNSFLTLPSCEGQPQPGWTGTAEFSTVPWPQNQSKWFSIFKNRLISHRWIRKKWKQVADRRLASTKSSDDRMDQV